MSSSEEEFIIKGYEKNISSQKKKKVGWKKG